MKKSTVLLLSLFTFSAQASNELTLMFIKSPGINWENPRSLSKSTVTSSGKTYALGHVNIRISCDGNGVMASREVHTGLYNRFAADTRDAVQKDGQGLGVLFNLFEGKIQEEKFIIPTFEKMAKDNRAKFVTFKINHSSCQRLLTYHDQYQTLNDYRQSLPRNPDIQPTPSQQIYYGFPAMPRLGEGAGCSGYAISFLEVAGLKEQWMINEWSQDLLIPAETVGLPMQNRRVTLRWMLFSSPKRWAKESEPSFRLFFWDPDLMISSTEKKIQSGMYKTSALYGAQGIVLDRTDVPTPTEPIFFNDISKTPSDPTSVYADIEELMRRYEYFKTPNYQSQASK